MTITRVKPAGWAVNEKLTSAQINQLDTNAMTVQADYLQGDNDERDWAQAAVEAATTDITTLYEAADVLLDDRVSDLENVQGTHRFASFINYSQADELGSVTHETWNSISYATTTGLATFPQVAIAGDIIEIHMSVRLYIALTSYGLVKLMKKEAGGSWQDIASPEHIIQYPNVIQQTLLLGYDTVGTGGTFELGITGKAGSGDTLTWQGSYTLSAKMWRAP